MIAPFCFYVHMNGVNQDLYNNQYNRLKFTAADFNDGGFFNFTQWRWIAPVGGRLHLSAQAHIFGLRISGPQCALKFIRNSATNHFPPLQPNGSDTLSPIGSSFYMSGTGNGKSSGDGWISVSTGDAIELALMTASESGFNSVVVDGHRAHTYWSGAFFPLSGTIELPPRTATDPTNWTATKTGG